MTADDETAADFANNPPPLNSGAKKGRAIPGQTFEVDGVCVRRGGETFRLIGLIDKGNACGVAVYVSRWRGVTYVELHEMERLHTAFSRTSVRTFLPPERVNDLIETLKRASDFVVTRPAPAKKRVAVRKQTQPKGNEPNENV